MAQQLRHATGGREERPPSHEDQWQAHVTREAALAIGEWLLASNRLDAPVKALSLPDLEAMATAAISRWVKVWSERLDDAPEEIKSLLLGA